MFTIIWLLLPAGSKPLNLLTECTVHAQYTVYRNDDKC